MQQAVNTIYFAGESIPDSTIDTWVMHWKLTGAPGLRCYCLELLHDRLVRTIVADNYAIIDIPYDAINAGTVDYAMQDWEPYEHGHFVPYLVKLIRLEGARVGKREARREQLLLAKRQEYIETMHPYSEEYIFDSDDLLDAIQTLCVRDQYIVCSAYGLCVPRHTQAWIGRTLGVTQQCVASRIACIVVKLTEVMT